MADDPYHVLGVGRDADIAALRRAYLARLREHHPDLRPDDPAAEERTRELNRAWDQVQRQRRDPARTAMPDSPRPARSAPAYSDQRRSFRTAFTTATLRIAVLVFALGLVLIALGR